MGQTFTLSHLAPFVDVSRQKLRKEVYAELMDTTDLGGTQLENAVEEIAERRLRQEVDAGLQTIQYQRATC